MFVQCKVKMINGSEVQLIPKLIPRKFGAKNCYGRVNDDIPPGYRICRIPDCLKKPCQNGWCQEEMTNYTCHCPPEFTGKHCESRIPTTQASRRTSPIYQNTSDNLTSAAESTPTDTQTESATDNPTTASDTKQSASSKRTDSTTDNLPTATEPSTSSAQTENSADNPTRPTTTGEPTATTTQRKRTTDNPTTKQSPSSEQTESATDPTTADDPVAMNTTGDSNSDTANLNCSFETIGTTTSTDLSCSDGLKYDITCTKTTWNGPVCENKQEAGIFIPGNVQVAKILLGAVKSKCVIDRDVTALAALSSLSLGDIDDIDISGIEIWLGCTYQNKGSNPPQNELRCWNNMTIPEWMQSKIPNGMGNGNNPKDCLLIKSHNSPNQPNKLLKLHREKCDSYQAYGVCQFH